MKIEDLVEIRNLACDLLEEIKLASESECCEIENVPDAIAGLNCLPLTLGAITGGLQTIFDNLGAENLRRRGKTS